MERRQLESAAANNHYLRGLLALPMAAVLFASGLGNMEWGPFGHFWVVPACFVLAAGAYGLLMRYYTANYGRVVPKVGARGVLGTAAAIVVMGGGSVVVQALDLPLNGIAVSWAVVALAYYGLTIGLKTHHLAIWGAVLVAGLAPVWADARTSDSSNVGLLMVGAAVVATGVLDHRLLVRTFGPSSGRRLEHSDAGD
jgi:hypothetical protein